MNISLIDLQTSLVSGAAVASAQVTSRFISGPGLLWPVPGQLGEIWREICDTLDPSLIFLAHMIIYQEEPCL